MFLDTTILEENAMFDPIAHRNNASNWDSRLLAWKIVQDRTQKLLANKDKEIPWVFYKERRETNAPLSDEDLVKQAQLWDASARDLLILRKTSLIKQLAHLLIREHTSSYSLLDLRQEWAIGLMDAIEKFNPQESSAAFTTYAIHRIKWTMRDFIRKDTNQVRWVKKVLQAYDVFVQHNFGKRPSIAELAKITGLPEIKVLRLITRMHTEISLDDIERHPYLEIGFNQDTDTFSESPEQIWELLRTSNLTENERFVIENYDLSEEENLTLKEIGVVLGVTEWRISQIRTGAIKKIRFRIDNPLKDSKTIAQLLGKAGLDDRETFVLLQAHGSAESLTRHSFKEISEKLWVSLSLISKIHSAAIKKATAYHGGRLPNYLK